MERALPVQQLALEIPEFTRFIHEYAVRHVIEEDRVAFLEWTDPQHLDSIIQTDSISEFNYQRNMNGTISISSELNVGTTVTTAFTFRRAQPQADYVDTKLKSQLMSLEGLHVLLVDDNELNREIACEILEENGMKVETAEDGDVAVERIKNIAPGEFDLVLMDIQMPRMNGYDATRAIRALDNTAAATIPIIAMTANAFEEDKQDAYSAGMNGHIAKPIDVPTLIATLSDTMNQ